MQSARYHYYSVVDMEICMNKSTQKIKYEASDEESFPATLFSDYLLEKNKRKSASR